MERPASRSEIVSAKSVHNLRVDMSYLPRLPSSLTLLEHFLDRLVANK